MPVTDPATAELWTNLGILAAAGVAALAGYFGKRLFGAGTPASSPPTTSVVAGVGLELGNREQTERLIAAVQAVADAIRDKKQAGMEGMLRKLVEEIDELRDEQRWQRPP